MAAILASGSLSLNPVRYLPQYGNSVNAVIELGESPGWRLERLGDIAVVFNGPRFKRPYAEEGVTSGPGITRYFTGTAMTQARGENLKYLDYHKASAIQRKQLDALTIHSGHILVTDSGTLGRIIYATQYHDGAIATNNLVRVVIEDEALRGFVYQFLTSDLGQHQLLRNTYGTIQDHLEPQHVEEVLIPIPEDTAIVERIGRAALQSIEQAEQSRRLFDLSRGLFLKVAEERIPYQAAED
jgi:type I restriction enzyme M protein